jgi:3-phytase
MGEEKRGLWGADAGATTPMQPRLVLPVGGLLHADVEGMGIYHGKTGSWVVVSSQGNDSYVVQDGHKRLPDGPQNFRLVAWDDVAKALGLQD